MAKVTAKLDNLRISPRKIRLTAEFIKGLDADKAMRQLAANVKRGNPKIQKLLASAVSNGENNFGLDKDNLYVYNILVEAGPTLKRWMPKAYGRAGQILKRTSRIKLTLEERVEGKGRKSKEQLEKEKKERLEAKRKTEKEAAKREQEEKGEVKKEAPSVKSAENREVKKVEKKCGITSRIFRRKSM